MVAVVVIVVAVAVEMEIMEVKQEVNPVMQIMLILAKSLVMEKPFKNLPITFTYIEDITDKIIDQLIT